MPTREDVLRKAREQYHNDNPHISTNPEYEELVESGYVYSATAELMLSEKSKNARWLEREPQPQQPQPIPLERPKRQPIPFDLTSALETGVSILGTRQCGKTTLAMQLTDILKQQIRSKSLIIYVIDPTRVWLTRRKDFTVVAIPPRTRHGVNLSWDWVNTIFDTSMLSTQQQQDFTEILCMTTLNTAIQLNEAQRPQLWIWFEEAHTPIPNFVFSSSKRLQETKRLITQGANFSISFGIVSQFASMVDKLPVKATQQRYFGLTSEPNDLGYIRKFIGEPVEHLRDLDTGEFLYSYRNTIKRFRTVTAETEKSQSVFNYSMVYQYQDRKSASLQKKKTTIAKHLLLPCGWSLCGCRRQVVPIDINGSECCGFG